MTLRNSYVYVNFYKVNVTCTFHFIRQVVVGSVIMLDKKTKKMLIVIVQLKVHACVHY